MTAPIPAALAERPTVGGLACPWVNVTLADGGCDFRTTHQAKWMQCWQQGLCQTCGEPLATPQAFLGGPNQAAPGGYFTEPPLHPWCAAYATRACPMVAGRMSHYAARQALADSKRGAKCPDPGCDCAGWVPHDPENSSSHGGEPAHPWFAVWADGWSLAVTPEGRLLGGIPSGVRRTRQVSHPTVSGGDPS